MEHLEQESNNHYPVYVCVFVQQKNHNVGRFTLRDFNRSHFQTIFS